MTFAIRDWPLPYFRVACKKCDREGKLHTDKLIEQYGENIDCFQLRERVTEAGCQRPDKATPCQSICSDAILVDAILADDENDAFKKEMLPEARKWREELGWPAAKGLVTP